jgi:hypothetical protein
MANPNPAATIDKPRSAARLRGRSCCGVQQRERMPVRYMLSAPVS